MKNVNSLPPFKRLCVTIGNLPSSYVDSMSYYECLMWLCKYLKETVIPTINENAEAVNELINWFNNLDVQDEIDNKLDKMAESGQLQEIISEYLNSTAVFGFDNVADMKEATNLINVSHATTMGYYAKNDGGNALYYITSSQPESGYYETLENGNYALLISDTNNVQCYGVSLDDKDNTNASKIRSLFATKSYLYCKNDLTLKSSLILDTVNTEFEFTNINYTGTGACIIIDNHDIKLKGINITSSASGVRLGYTNVVLNVDLQINRIDCESNGIILGGTSGVLNSALRIEQINYKNHGIYFDLSSSYVGQMTIYNTNFTDLSSGNTDNYAIYMDTSNNSCTGLTMYNPSFEGSRGGIYVTSTTYKYLEHLRVYGSRISEMSINNQRKALKLVASNLSCKVIGNFDFDTCDVDCFDLTEYHAYSQEALQFNGAFVNRGSADIVANSANSNYGGLILTKHSRSYYGADANGQVIKTIYDSMFLNNGSSNTLKINVMPKQNALFGGHFRVYIAGNGITNFKIATGTSDNDRVGISVAQNDIVDIYINPEYYRYGYQGYYIKYNKSTGAVSSDRFSGAL